LLVPDRTLEPIYFKSKRFVGITMEMPTNKFWKRKNCWSTGARGGPTKMKMERKCW